MQWFRVDNAVRTQPATGTYSEWKSEIAKACRGQCVYCAISESRYGGLDNFHVDHYRPKSRFKDLLNSIANLYLACAICNRFKSDDWPNEPQSDHSVAAYPDPGEFDYTDLMQVDGAAFLVVGHHVASTYVVERLYLNRPQLVRERRGSALILRIQAIRTELAGIIAGLATDDTGEQGKQLLADIATALSSILGAHLRADAAAPYQLSEIQRPKKGKKVGASKKQQKKSKTTTSKSATKKAKKANRKKRSKKNRN